MTDQDSFRNHEFQHELMEKTANKAAAETVRLAKTEIRMEMLEMKHSLISDLTTTIDRKFESGLGMPPADHCIAHREIDELIEATKDVKRGLFKTLSHYGIAGFISFAVAAYYSSTDADPAIKPMDAKPWVEKNWMPPEPDPDKDKDKEHSHSHP